MGAVAKSLPELFAKRMGELGTKSVRELYQRLPDDGDCVTYETVRKLYNGEQRGTRDERVPRDLALMLGVDENVVREAMSIPPTYGPWEIPPRAQSLDPDERDAVMGVIDALLRAKRTGGTERGGTHKAEKSDEVDGPSVLRPDVDPPANPFDEGANVTELRPTEPPTYDPEEHAARKGTKEPPEGEGE